MRRLSRAGLRGGQALREHFVQCGEILRAEVFTERSGVPDPLCARRPSSLEVGVAAVVGVYVWRCGLLWQRLPVHLCVEGGWRQWVWCAWCAL